MRLSERFIYKAALQAILKLEYDAEISEANLIATQALELGKNGNVQVDGLPKGWPEGDLD